MVRSIGAVAAGYIIFGVSAALLFQLSGQLPHEAAPTGFKIGSIVWGAVFALVAGWLTARIASRRPAMHAGVLAGLIALGAVISMAAAPGDAMWSQVSALVVMAPCAWIGGALAGGSSIGRVRRLE
jgi:multisubunit Na+/H+ antiporter MnhE subunit